MKLENEFDIFVDKAKEAFDFHNKKETEPDTTYHYTGAQGSYGADSSPYTAPFTPPPKKEKPKFTKRMSVRIIAAALAVVMISVGSIGGFAALVNAGYIHLSGSSSSGNAFTLNSNGASSSSTTNVSSGEKLTRQQVAEKVIPSVVCIQNLQNSTSQRGVSTTSSPTVASEGSGIIMTSDGYIITNAHVVDGADSLSVILSDGTTYEAKLVGSDSFTDLALIKIDATGLTPAEFGNSDELAIGDEVVAIGNPGGLEFSSSTTYGYVSALGRNIANSDGYTMHCIQTDAAINPGNSGGPLINMYGQVVGINSSKIVATGYEGLGFAISINEAQPIITSLKNYGYVKDRAVFGISYKMIDESMSRFYGLPVGIYVGDINSDNVSKAGITKGDVITKIGDKDITSATIFLDAIKDLHPGDTVSVTVYKALSGKTETIQVVLSELTVGS